MRPNYPDTTRGAKAALLALSTYTTTSKTRYTPDSSQPGVWLITGLVSEFGDPAKAIVYLAGYPDAFGRVRDEDDFESEEEIND